MLIVAALICQTIMAQTMMSGGGSSTSLAPEAVWAQAQTADGYLWMGTVAGLYRFDDIRFELFRSPFGDRL